MESVEFGLKWNQNLHMSQLILALYNTQGSNPSYSQWNWTLCDRAQKGAMEF